MKEVEGVGRIVKVSGPLVVAEGMGDARMFDVVRVSERRLIGEIIELQGERAFIQVYENTGGLGPGEPVYMTGEPLSVELGPGLVGSIYDGIQRPLDIIKDQTGDYITRGIDIPSLDREKTWHFVPSVKIGEKVTAGDILGTVQETPLVTHRVIVPLGIEGMVEEIKEGTFRVEEAVARIRTDAGLRDLTMFQRWPVRSPRPYRNKLVPNIPLITGQRVIDTFFPVGKGGTACVPGPFGSGKTVIQHQLAKWSDADIIVFIGCGERGNEMASVLLEFPELTDPRTGRPLMERTVLVANTSNMPVAAREASVYTGITIAEYFRDMGYDVALMADSTSRWAEAMREMSGRLEEMPGEEGYPAYLGTRIAEFYERAGKVVCLGNDGRESSLTVIGSVSPPGGDLADPVVQSTLRVVKVFWSLEDQLAYQRHFPAISWLNSYSLYYSNLEDYLTREVREDFTQLRTQAMRLLQQEADLQEIVKLVGIEALSPGDRLILEIARSIREDFLHQNAFMEADTYTSLKKQCGILKLILTLYDLSKEALEGGVTIEQLSNLKVREEIARAKFTPEDQLDQFEAIGTRMETEIQGLVRGSEEVEMTESAERLGS
ncbi:MAG TPA: V-type ATP synthase subunit A [Candidatus Latescibacteria bacterium]|nr:V-type ATP synthase subunit A [Candidatus Latescibacterota bacterium]